MRINRKISVWDFSILLLLLLLTAVKVYHIHGHLHFFQKRVPLCATPLSITLSVHCSPFIAASTVAFKVRGTAVVDDFDLLHHSTTESYRNKAIVDLDAVEVHP